MSATGPFAMTFSERAALVEVTAGAVDELVVVGELDGEVFGRVTLVLDVVGRETDVPVDPAVKELEAVALEADSDADVLKVVEIATEVDCEIGDTVMGPGPRLQNK